MAKKPLETGKDEILIRLIPKSDEDGDWIHETLITCKTSDDLPSDAYEHYLDLARAMVGFSYGSDHEEVIEYTSHFYNILSGSSDKEEVSNKDNIIYLNKWNNDD